MYHLLKRFFTLFISKFSFSSPCLLYFSVFQTLYLRYHVCTEVKKDIFIPKDDTFFIFKRKECHNKSKIIFHLLCGAGLSFGCAKKYIKPIRNKRNNIINQWKESMLACLCNYCRLFHSLQPTPNSCMVSFYSSFT